MLRWQENYKKNKKLLININITLFTIVILIVIFELFFRLYNPYKIYEIEDYSEIEENETITNFNNFSLSGETNSMGLRDKEYDFDHDSYRILAIGDSFTYGVKLKNSNSWPKKTGKYLHDKGYDNIEILNGGRQGTNTRGQYEFFTEYTSKYNPNMVIIGFIINDCSSLCSNCGAVDLKYRFDDLVRRTENKHRSYILKYINLEYLKHKLIKETVKEYSNPYDNNLEEFQNCKKAFLDFKKSAEDNDFELVVVIYPMLYQLNKNHPFMGIHKKIESFLKSSGIKVYDLTPSFYGYKDIDLWADVLDSHPNKKANEIAAKRIAEIIEENLN